MPLPLIYHEDYSPEFPADHRFPMDKFRLLRDHLVDSGLVRDEELHRPDTCPPEILALAHCPDYIERFANGELTGKGEYRGSDGRHYQGDFRRWRFHGQGKLSLADGIARIALR